MQGARLVLQEEAMPSLGEGKGNFKQGFASLALVCFAAGPFLSFLTAQLHVPGQRSAPALSQP